MGKHPKSRKLYIRNRFYNSKPGTMLLLWKKYKKYVLPRKYSELIAYLCYFTGDDDIAPKRELINLILLCTNKVDFSEHVLNILYNFNCWHSDRRELPWFLQLCIKTNSVNFTDYRRCTGNTEIIPYILTHRNMLYLKTIKLDEYDSRIDWKYNFMEMYKIRNPVIYLPLNKNMKILYTFGDEWYYNDDKYRCYKFIKGQWISLNKYYSVFSFIESYKCKTYYLKGCLLYPWEIVDRGLCI